MIKRVDICFLSYSHNKFQFRSSMKGEYVKQYLQEQRTITACVFCGDKIEFVKKGNGWTEQKLNSMEDEVIG